MDHSPESVQKRTRVGLLLSVLEVGFTKCISLVSQVVLGSLLSKVDFGLFASAISMSAVTTSLRDGGAGKFLIQQGDQYGSVFKSAFRLAFIVNVLIAVSLLVLGYVMWGKGGPKSTSGILLMWIALSVVVYTPAFLGKSLAAFHLNFKWIATVSSLTVTVRYSAMIVFALLGFGPFSFVYPIVLSAIFEACFYYWYFRKHRASSPISKTEVSLWGVLKETRWIILGSLAIALINNGDYLVMTQFLDTDLVGVYFFGFQLTVGLSAIFTGTIQNVLLPSYTRSQSTIQETVVKHVGNLFLVSAPICVAAALSIGPIIEFVWQGKWNDAISVSQFLLVALAFRLGTPVLRAAVESTGRWRVQGFLLWADAIGTMSVSFVVLVSGVTDLAVFAFWIAVYRVAYTLAQMFVSSRVLNVSVRKMYLALLPLVLAIGMGVSIHWGIGLLLPAVASWLRGIVEVAVFLVGYALANRRDPQYNQILLLVKQKLRRRS